MELVTREGLRSLLWVLFKEDMIPVKHKIKTTSIRSWVSPFIFSTSSSDKGPLRSSALFAMNDFFAAMMASHLVTTARCLCIRTLASSHSPITATHNYEHQWNFESYFKVNSDLIFPTHHTPGSLELWEAPFCWLLSASTTAKNASNVVPELSRHVMSHLFLDG